MEQHQLEQYIKEHRATVFRLAYSYVKNREDADDITQDAFMRLYVADPSFEGASNVKAWLIRVTINLAKDMLRSGWYRSRAELPDNIPCESEEEERLLDSVKKLNAENAAVIYLFYYEGYSVKEIAKLRRTTSAAVRTRLCRAREQLRKMLTKEDL
ncbi:MAG: sigma-70 family RNA polymerase sigma factor [Oscillospiraceae bacterium]|nr:sigma-70 family RNA polymerase sigma factor [Oscillospiraceae bacterium]